MEIIKIGEPVITKTGTIVQRFIKDGRLYKSIDFSNSVNKIAQQKGLIKTIVEYGEGNKPERIKDTFERVVSISAAKSPKVQTIENAEEIATETTEAKYTAEPKAIIDKTTSDEEIAELSNKSILYPFKKVSKNTELYREYYKFIDSVKDKLDRYASHLPAALCADIINKYGIEEKSIKKILQDNNVISENIHAQYSTKDVKAFIRWVETKEKYFENVDITDINMRNSAVYTNAWARSHLKFQLTEECRGTWCILKPVWLKCLYPDTTKYSTDKLIDAYLIHEYRQKDGIFKDFGGKNPLQKYEDEPKLTKGKIAALKVMYSSSKNLKNESMILSNPAFRKFKESANLEAMAKTIEDMEQHYKNAFFKYFWNDYRREKFSKILTEEFSRFNKQVELTDEVYEIALIEAMAEESLSE